ncbi:MAG: zinc ribbon domain-containing protein [Planctomycetes bacterium]|nr:zinc ribbon domain-containing protein [Planctomycetota bacterium]
MPIYEYANDTDEEVIELLRPMADADKPVEDPAGRNRKFMRRHSVFGVVGAGASAEAPMPSGGCCPCGKSQSMCGRN